MRRRNGNAPSSPVRFQSTHPIRNATSGRTPLYLRWPVSIHASHTECDRRGMAKRFRPTSFNPRIPYGMRLVIWTQIKRDGSVSIHASHTECDGRSRLIPSTFNRFNPRIPYGMRRHAGRRDYAACRFQSTHPIRNATPAGSLKTW